MTFPDPEPRPGATIEPFSETTEQATARREQQHRHEMELQQEITKREILKSKHSLRSDRVVVWVTLAIAGAVAAAISVITIAIYHGDKNGNVEDVRFAQIEQQRETQCVDSGGAWVPASALADPASGNGRGLCVTVNTTQREATK